MAGEKAYEIPTVDRLIATINGGDDGAEISKEYHALIEKLADPAYGDKRKGKMTISIDFAADAKGVDVLVTSKVSAPVRPKTKDRLFVSASGDSLTAKNPNNNTFFEGDDLGRRRAAVN